MNLLKRKYRHVTPKYIWNRFRSKSWERKYPDTPWIPAPMVKFLNTYLQKVDHGFEFGSGRSTIWYGQRLKTLVSVEHDLNWYEIVEKNLRNQGCENIKLFKAEPNSYTCQLKDNANNSLDFVVIDGIVRDECAWLAVEKVKRGGIILLDDAQRYLPWKPRSDAPYSLKENDPYPSKTWKSVGETLKFWRQYWASDGIKDCSVFWKPW